jgi:formylglycine-generating enzyme required for sulfatase activity
VKNVLLIVVLLAACRDHRRNDVAPPGPAPAKRVDAPSRDASPTRVVRVPGGRVLGRDGECHLRSRYLQRVWQTVADFGIDYVPVSCAQWRACAAAGACRSCDEEEYDEEDAPCYCGAGVVSVELADARAFCRWRGGRLPTWNEWHRALRGDRDDERAQPATCRYTRGDVGLLEDRRPCQFVSPQGVQFEFDNLYNSGNHGEWTSFVECGIEMAVEKGSLEFDNPGLGGPAAIRCAYD